MDRLKASGVGSYKNNLTDVSKIMESHFPKWANALRSTSEIHKYFKKIIKNYNDVNGLLRKIEFKYDNGNIFEPHKLFVTSETELKITNDEFIFLDQLPITYEKGNVLYGIPLGDLEIQISNYYYDIVVERNNRSKIYRFNYYDNFLRNIIARYTGIDNKITVEIDTEINIPMFISDNHSVDIERLDYNIVWLDSLLYIVELDIDRDGFISQDDIIKYKELTIISDILDVDGDETHTEDELKLIDRRLNATLTPGWYIIHDKEESISISYYDNLVDLSGDIFVGKTIPTKLKKLPDTKDIIYLDRQNHLYFNDINLNMFKDISEKFDIIDFDIYGSNIYYISSNGTTKTLGKLNLLNMEFLDLLRFDNLDPMKLACFPDDRLAIWENGEVIIYNPIYGTVLESLNDENEPEYLNYNEVYNTDHEIKLLTRFDLIAEWFRMYRHRTETLYQFRNRINHFLNCDKSKYVDILNVFFGFTEVDTDQYIETIELDYDEIDFISDMFLKLDNFKYKVKHDIDTGIISIGNIDIGSIDGNILRITEKIDRVINYDIPMNVTCILESESCKLVFEFNREYSLMLYLPITDQGLSEVDTKVISNSKYIQKYNNARIYNNINMYDYLINGITIYDNITLSLFQKDTRKPVIQYDYSEQDILPKTETGIYDELSFGNPRIESVYGEIIDNIGFYGNTDNDEVKYRAQELVESGYLSILNYVCDPGVFIDKGTKKLFSSFHIGHGTRNYFTNTGNVYLDKYENLYLDLAEVSKIDDLNNTIVIGDSSQEIKLSIEKSYLSPGQFYVNLIPKNYYPGGVSIYENILKTTGENNTINPNPKIIEIIHSGIGFNTLEYSKNIVGLFRDEIFKETLYKFTSTLTNEGVEFDRVEIVKTEDKALLNEEIYTSPYYSVNPSNSNLPKSILTENILKTISFGNVSITLDKMIVLRENLSTEYINYTDTLCKFGSFHELHIIYDISDFRTYRKDELLAEVAQYISEDRVIVDAFLFLSSYFRNEAISSNNALYAHNSKLFFNGYSPDGVNSFILDNDLSNYRSKNYSILKNEMLKGSGYTVYVLTIPRRL